MSTPTPTPTPTPTERAEAVIAAWTKGRVMGDEHGTDPQRAFVAYLAKAIEEAEAEREKAVREECATLAKTWQERPDLQMGHDDDGKPYPCPGCLTAFSEGMECGAASGIAAAILAKGGE